MIFTLVVAIGFVVSYLLTKSRRAELAVMRSMGAGKLKTFFILFIEQLILCIFGAIIGIWHRLYLQIHLCLTGI